VKRVCWFVLDSVGIGGAPDAATFGDEGADTLGHIAEWFLEKKGRVLSLPTLKKLGLGESYRLVHDRLPRGWDPRVVIGTYAAAQEVSTGKDTPSGHWEMAGVPATWDWGYFPDEKDCFSKELLDEIHTRCKLDGSLGHCHASGTEIVSRLGKESVNSGKPIFYTSADSVFQIAAHEEAFGLERLYELCEVVRELLMDDMVGRVIARPFVGDGRRFERTGNRRDYSIKPPKPTVLAKVHEAGGEVYGVGKIGDIFAHEGLTHERKATGHEELWLKTREAMEEAGDGALVMTNFVDFDMLYGHRRDPKGYGMALEDWDRELARFLDCLDEGDLLIVTADHGNDPTWKGTDHTREQVPVLVYGSGRGDGGVRESFTDIGATAAKWLGVEVDEGTSIL